MKKSVGKGTSRLRQLGRPDDTEIGMTPGKIGREDRLSILLPARRGGKKAGEKGPRARGSSVKKRPRNEVSRGRGLQRRY